MSLKCYSVTFPKSQIQVGAPINYIVTDNLFPGVLGGTVGVDPNVTGSQVQYICAPASFVNPQ